MIRQIDEEAYSFVQLRAKLLIGLVISCFVLLVFLVASISYGPANVSLKEIYEAFTAFNGSAAHLIVRTVRLPRSILAIIVGSAMSVAGAIAQGITRNPLADPGILGINAGAVLFVVIAIFFFGTSEPSFYIWSAFAGAGATTIGVYFLASLGRGGVTPLSLTISGAAISALLFSLSTAILILSDRTIEEIRLWLAGSVADTEASIIWQVLPYISIGMILAFALSRQITILSLGEDVAKGLGQQTLWVKVTAAAIVLLLAGSAVAVAGPIEFLGLVVPQVVRLLVGSDFVWILPYSAVFGALLLLISDMAARSLLQPQELPVGVMTALVGAPFFIYLARTRVKK